MKTKTETSTSTLAILLVVLVVVFLATMLGFSTCGASSGATSDTASTSTGTSDAPLVGSDGNIDPLLLEEAESWTDLVVAIETMSNGQWYKDCLRQRIGLTWEQVKSFAAAEQREGYAFRLILVSNASVTDAEAREALYNKGGYTDLERCPVVRVSGFNNTRLYDGRWAEFWDERCQVRLSLAIPIDSCDISKGYILDRGVLVMCGNPWDLPKEPPVTTPTTPLEPKHAEDLPPSSKTPPATCPSTPTTQSGGGSTAGPGAMSTVSTPTSECPPVPNTDSTVSVTVPVPDI